MQVLLCMKVVSEHKTMQLPFVLVRSFHSSAATALAEARKVCLAQRPPKLYLLIACVRKYVEFCEAIRILR